MIETFTGIDGGVEYEHPGMNTSALFDSIDIPSTAFQRALGVELAFNSFLFILFHELRHLAQGHCKFCKENKFFDFGHNGDGSVSIDDEDRQALEFMADVFAARDLLIYIRSVRDEIFLKNSSPVGLTVTGKALEHCVADPFLRHSRISLRSGLPSH